MELSEELVVLEAKGILELFFGDTVKNVLEGLLIRVVDKLVNEGTLTFVTPQADEEETWVLDFLKG